MKSKYERANLLREAREKKGYSQTELAELLNYSNKTISKWELGESYPTDYNTLQKYSKLLDLEISEIIIGKKNTTDEEIIVGYLKLKKKYFDSVIKLIILTILLFLLTFFLAYNYFEKDKIKVYELSTSKDDSNKNLLFKSNKINILYFNKIESTKPIDYVSLYYKKNNKQIEIFHGSNDNYFIKDYVFVNEYNLVNTDFKTLYLDIHYKDNTKETKKISVKELYRNNKIYYYNNNKELENKKNEEEFLLKEGFVKKDNIYSLEKDNASISYNSNIKEFTILINDNNIIEIKKKYKNNYYYYTETTPYGKTTINKKNKEELLYDSNIYNQIKYLFYLENKMFSS